MLDIDVPAVLKIERESHSVPWTEKAFLEELQRDWGRLVVAERTSEGALPRVVGFCNYWLVADEIQLLNLCVAKAHRRSGLARRLMGQLLEVFEKRRCRVLTLEVRVSNAAAIGLYQGFGFVGVGLRKGYYADNLEDALVMLLQRAGADPVS